MDIKSILSVNLSRPAYNNTPFVGEQLPNPRATCGS